VINSMTLERRGEEQAPAHGERGVRESGAEWTIVRSSMVSPAWDLAQPNE
jgi:hypothetical protein